MTLSPQMSLSRFFDAFFVPEVMENPSPRACEGYRYALARWRDFTGDPPLAEITSATLADFKQRLAAVRVRGDHEMSQNTRRKYLDHIQWILDQAGPPMAVRRLRTAAGLLDRVPWTKPPARERKKKLPTDEDRVIALYRFAERAVFPKLDGMTAPAWWRAAISTICCTSLRVGQLVQVPYAAVVWDAVSPALRLSADMCRKSKSDETHPLHPVALRDLLAIRGDRKLLFPAWPEPHSKTTIYHEFHRLERLAGFEPQAGIAFHGIRRRILTELGKISSTAAQMAAGHQSYQTTISHYIGIEALASAVNQLGIFGKLAQ